MISRRSIFGMLVSGAAVAVARPFAKTARPASPSELFKSGEPIGFGWSLQKASSPTNGAIFLDLVHESGATAHVRACRREGEPIGPAHSDLLDFVIMSPEGTRTEETLGRALLQLAETVRKNERTHFSALKALNTHRQFRAILRT
jgi:hypothetical protein